MAFLCEGDSCSVVNRNGSAHPAPDFGAVLAGRSARNIDFYTTNAGDSVLHGDGQWVMIDELNAQSSRRIHTSKHMKLLLAEKPLTSSKTMVSIRPPA